MEALITRLIFFFFIFFLMGTASGKEYKKEAHAIGTTLLGANLIVATLFLFIFKKEEYLLVTHITYLVLCMLGNVFIALGCTTKTFLRRFLERDWRVCLWK